jgi:hypothetical protein
MMLNPFNLVHMLAVEYRWIPIVYYTLFIVLKETVKSLFNEATQRDSSAKSALSCLGITKYNEDLDTEMADLLWAGCQVTIGAVCGSDKQFNADICSKIVDPEDGEIKFKEDEALSIRSFYVMNYLAFFIFIPFYVLWPLFLFVRGSGNWKLWRGYDDAYLKTLQGAVLHVYYRRFILTANITTLCIFIWTLYRGLHHGMTSFVFILISGIITVLLALPPAVGKVMEVGDVEEGTEKLMKFNDSIFAKVRQTLLVNSGVYAAQMAFFNFPEKYATAPAGSALPGPLTALKCFQALCGEGDLDDIIPTKNVFSGTAIKKKSALQKAQKGVATVEGGFGF